MYTIEEIKEKLSNAGYMASDDIAFGASVTINLNRPIILEGAPGAGKTSLAKAVADALDLPLIRMQFYQGLTAEQILYDYDYQKQLLTIQAISASLEGQLKNKTVDEAIHAVQGMDFYNMDFLIARPLMKAITSEKQCVLLLDEVDKSSEEVEHILLEFLEGYSISVPQLGTIQCDPEKKPIVFITSNCFRELSEPLKRRCGYLYIENKTEAELAEIIKSKIDLDTKLVKVIAKEVHSLQNLTSLDQKPSTAEAIQCAEVLASGSTLRQALLSLAKSKSDYKVIKKRVDKLSQKIEDGDSYDKRFEDYIYQNQMTN